MPKARLIATGPAFVAALAPGETATFPPWRLGNGGWVEIWVGFVFFCSNFFFGYFNDFSLALKDLRFFIFSRLLEPSWSVRCGLAKVPHVETGEETGWASLRFVRRDVDESCQWMSKRYSCQKQASWIQKKTGSVLTLDTNLFLFYIWSHI